MILMRRLILKLKNEYAVILCQIKAGNIKTNQKVWVSFFLPEFSAVQIVMWKLHVDDSSERRYVRVLGRYLLTALVLNLKYSKHVTKSGNGPF